MIVLDTNVVSETLRARPSPGVMQWLESRGEPFALAAVTIGELLTGVRLLPRASAAMG